MEDIKSTLTKERIEQIQEAFEDINQFIADPSIIRDNKIIFFDGEEIYRVCMPDQKQLAEADHIQHKLYGELIQTEGCYLENRLKKILKEKQDIDISELEKVSEKALKAFHDAQIEWVLIAPEEKERRDKQREKVVKLEEEYRKLSTPIIEHLSHSIENRCRDKYVKYLTALCTEKLIDKKEEKWEKVWNSYSDFEKVYNSTLVTKSINRMACLLLNSRES